MMTSSALCICEAATVFAPITYREFSFSNRNQELLNFACAYKTKSILDINPHAKDHQEQHLPAWTSATKNSAQPLRTADINPDKIADFLLSTPQWDGGLYTSQRFTFEAPHASHTTAPTISAFPFFRKIK